jgi:hypothetical protein
MTHSEFTATKRSRRAGAKARRRGIESRYTVGLPADVAHRVERYAETADTSMSKAIAALVRLGLEGQEIRKREFFKKLRQNLASNNPVNEDQLVDEFRDLILGC